MAPKTDPTPEQRAAAAEWIRRWRLDDSRGYVEALAELLVETAEACVREYEASGPYEAKALDVAADRLAELSDPAAVKVEAIVRNGSAWLRRFEAERDAALKRAEEAERVIAIWRERCGAAERDLAIAGVRGSPPPGIEQTIPLWMRRAYAAEAEAAALRQTSGELCDTCGWRGMRGADPCAFCEAAALRKKVEELEAVHRRHCGLECCPYLEAALAPPAAAQDTERR